jgi:hypothetical protein
VNCARGGQAAPSWIDPYAHNVDANNAHNNYDLCRDNHMTPQGVKEAQVQVAWVKVADPLVTPQSKISLPNTGADAYTLETEMGQIVRALKTRYPNIKQVYFGSRIYGGYDSGMGINPEPYAFEGGLAVKWLIQAQIDQTRNNGRVVDTHAGDLNEQNYPWLGWGAYLWSNGMKPRAVGTSCDVAGTTWSRSEMLTDVTHPNQAGQQKVGKKLLDFFLCSDYSSPWFSANGKSILP